MMKRTLLIIAAIAGLSATVSAEPVLDPDAILVPNLDLMDEERAAEAKPTAEKDLLSVGQVMTMVNGNPGLFHCLLDRDAVPGGGHLLVPINKYYHDLELYINSQPVVVYEPAGRLWRKVKHFHPEGPMIDKLGRRYSSVLPAGRQCFAPMPGRYVGNHLATYALTGKAWARDVNWTPVDRRYNSNIAALLQNAYRFQNIKLRHERYTFKPLDKNDMQK